MCGAAGDNALQHHLVAELLTTRSVVHNFNSTMSKRCLNVQHRRGGVALRLEDPRTPSGSTNNLQDVNLHVPDRRGELAHVVHVGRLGAVIRDDFVNGRASIHVRRHADNLYRPNFAERVCFEAAHCPPSCEPPKSEVADPPRRVGSGMESGTR